MWREISRVLHFRIFNIQEVRLLRQPAFHVQTGMLVWGTVEHIVAYGAFIDIGDGVTALLYIDQISNERVTSQALQQLFAVGDRVRAMVRKVDPQKRRVDLSTKELERHAGDMLRDPSSVYENAEAAAALFFQRDSGGEDMLTRGGYVMYAAAQQDKAARRKKKHQRPSQEDTEFWDKFKVGYCFIQYHHEIWVPNIAHRA